MESRYIGDVVDSLIGMVEQRKAVGGVEFLGIPTGFNLVDKYTGGMQSDQLWIVAAATGAGKTSLALDMTLATARYSPDDLTLFYSLEMSGEVLVNRLIARMTGVSGGKIIRGQIDDDELSKVVLAAEELQDLNIQIIDSTATALGITEHAMGLREQFEISAVFVDYLQLLADDAGMPETERVGTISRRLRALGRPDYLNCPVVALSQLSRASQQGESKVPQLHHLKNSSNLEQDANVVLLLYRPAVEKAAKGQKPQDIENDAQIIIAKNREGFVGMTEAQFIPRLTQWKQ